MLLDLPSNQFWNSLLPATMSVIEQKLRLVLNLINNLSIQSNAFFLVLENAQMLRKNLIRKNWN